MSEKSTNPSKIALIQINLSVLIMGHTTLFAKILPFGAVTIIGVRSIFAALAVLAFLFIRKQLHHFVLNRKRDYAFLFSLGILLALHWVTYFHAIQVSTISVGMISLFTYPVFTAILEPFFFGGRISVREIILCCIVFVGLTLVAFSSTDLSLDSSYVEGVLWGLFSAIVYSVRNLLTKRNMVYYSSSILLVFQLLVTSILLLPFLESNSIILEWSNLWKWMVLGFFFTALPHVLYLQGLRKMKATTIGIISTISPIYGTIAAWMYLNEVPTNLTIVGGLLVLGASTYEVIKQQTSLDTQKNIGG
ncbi:DMT family transporter [Leptospira sp. GIMC2001]|uniref:DMT family transporter n=1 Tax=Leptospira sp. GIMC2001 TaxID=1513297 RepID=UPI00234BFF6F|nr:DMT family transporter [Leptospira sp. GIMC2001]WCL47650.1 DMT family transporter [Leptospira sp. GIMC2001]